MARQTVESKFMEYRGTTSWKKDMAGIVGSANNCKEACQLLSDATNGEVTCTIAPMTRLVKEMSKSNLIPTNSLLHRKEQGRRGRPALPPAIQAAKDKAAKERSANAAKRSANAAAKKAAAAEKATEREAKKAAAAEKAAEKAAERKAKTAAKIAKIKAQLAELTEMEKQSKRTRKPKAAAATVTASE